MKEYYRNELPIGDIDESSLWEKKDNSFVLVDDDDYRALPVGCWGHCFVREQ